MTNHLETVARKYFKQADITWQMSVLIGWDERTNIATATTNITDNICITKATTTTIIINIIMMMLLT